MASADFVVRARKVVLLLGASSFLTVQLALQDHAWSLETPSGVYAILGMAIWGLALLALVGPWVWRSRDQAVDDERIGAARWKALSVGYGAMLIAAGVMFYLATRNVMEAAEATQLIFAIGVAAPMYGFAIFE